MKKNAKKIKKSVNKSSQKSSSLGISPLGDRIVIKPLTADEGLVRPSGIIIPDTAKDKPEQGTVVAVGPGKYEDGARVPVGVSVGDKVMFSKYGFDELKLDGNTYLVIAEANVLAILN